jgi:protein phosphatase
MAFRKRTRVLKIDADGTGYCFGCLTDIGLVRQYNEDNYYVFDESSNHRELGMLIAVADGMGGHNGGDVASQVAVNTVASYYSTRRKDSALDRLISTVEQANRQIFDISQDNEGLYGMGTTLTTMVFRGREAIVAHVGDSRAYLFREGQLTQLTDDHSLVAQAVREGILTPEQAARHPQRSIITRALGTRDAVEVDSMTLQVQPGDIMVVSSDGLHGFVEDEDIQNLIMAHGDDPDELARQLVQAALANGGNDNVSLVTIHVRDP